MLRSLLLATALMALIPLAVDAGEITLLPSIKLRTGNRDHYGNYWDSGHWCDHGYWHCNYKWRKNRWWHHDSGCYRGWGKRRAHERGYHEDQCGHDDHRGRGHGHRHRH